MYLHAPDELAPWAPGAASRWWLHRALESFTADLHKRRSRLIIRRGDDSLALLRELIKKTGADAVYWNRLYEPATIARDKRVKSALKDDGVQVSSHQAALLWEPWTVETNSGGPYRVYTPYWKNCRGNSIDEPLPPPKPLPGARGGDWPDSLELDALGLLPDTPWFETMDNTWDVSEAGAHARLETICTEVVPDYSESRNLPAVDGVSRLSPYLHHGLLSPRQVWRAVAKTFDDEPLNDKSAETFLSEIGWREFSHHVLYHFPESTEQPVQQKFKDYPWYQGKDRDERLRAWQRGKTGVPIVDAGMRQLWRTGWMHNRVRMLVASYLTKNLRIHWLEGARWFWDTLVDADLASNTMGWQWTAGSGFDAAPYFRIFNPVLQGERYDPKGDYVRRWVGELADHSSLKDKKIHQPWAADRPPQGYPEPLVDLGESRQTRA